MLRRRQPALLLVLFAWLLLIVPGCPPAENGGGKAPAGGTKSSEGQAAKTGEATEEELEAELEPFDAPPLAELDKSAEWEDMPVRNAYELYKDHLAQSEPLVSVEEALSLRNTSPENNEKIISALGRPPGSDAAVGWDRGITRAIGADIKSSNPLMISSSAEFEVLGLTGFGMFSFDWNFKPFAMSAFRRFAGLNNSSRGLQDCFQVRTSFGRLVQQ